MTVLNPHGDAAGTGLESLVSPCKKRRNPTRPPDPADGRSIALAFSGGGFRASLPALGVLKLLEDVDLLANVRFVSSVSGGSVTAGLLATRWDKTLKDGVEDALIRPFVSKMSSKSLKWTIGRNLWRTLGPTNRTELLAQILDRWWMNDVEMASLSPDVRWIINAANQTTGARFGFERDRIGDYVCGEVAMPAAGVSVSTAVAASAAVPGLFPPITLPDSVEFGCPERGRPQLVDGGAYDNSGLAALEHNTYNSAFTMALNAGGAFRIGSGKQIPIIRELQLANSMLYRQSTALRTSEMVSRFKQWEAAERSGNQPGLDARPGVLFALATTFDQTRPTTAAWTARFPEHRTWDLDGKETDLAFVPTVFDRLDEALCHRLIYRGWWLAGAALSSYHPDLLADTTISNPPRHN